MSEGRRPKPPATLGGLRPTEDDPLRLRHLHKGRPLKRPVFLPESRRQSISKFPLGTIRRYSSRLPSAVSAPLPLSDAGTTRSSATLPNFLSLSLSAPRSIVSVQVKIRASGVSSAVVK